MRLTDRQRRRRAIYQYHISSANERACISCRWFRSTTSHCEVLEQAVTKVGICIAHRPQPEVAWKR